MHFVAANGLLVISFKWGTQPTMELLLASYGGSQNTAVVFCFTAWILVLFFTLVPLAFV